MLYGEGVGGWVPSTTVFCLKAREVGFTLDVLDERLTHKSETITSKGLKKFLKDLPWRRSLSTMTVEMRVEWWNPKEQSQSTASKFNPNFGNLLMSSI
jgi:hypothetical protein